MGHSIISKRRCAISIFIAIFSMLFSTIHANNNKLIFESVKVDQENLQQEQRNTLQQLFDSYEIHKIDIDALADFAIASSDPYKSFTLHLGSHTWAFELEANDLRSKDYKLQLITEEGLKIAQPSAVSTFKGILNGNPNNQVRLSLYEGHLSGRVLQEGTEYFIEPLSSFLNESDKNHFIVYKTEDISSGVRHFCGKEPLAKRILEKRQQITQTNRECILTEIAVAADYSMYTFYGDLETVEKEIVGVLNIVQDLYEELDIQYSLVATTVSNCFSCDPWLSTTNASALLLDFQGWGNSNGFGNMEFDVASLWTKRDLVNNNDPSTIGLAEMPSTCTDEKFNVLENLDFRSTNAISQAHELGHNWGADHTEQNQINIMSPGVGSNNRTWSSASIQAMENYISTINCVSACNYMPTPGFIVSNTTPCAGTVYFLNKTRNTDEASWLWDFGDGTTSTEKNPVHTYAFKGTYTVTLKATNAYGERSVIEEKLITVKGTGGSENSIQRVGPTNKDIGSGRYFFENDIRRTHFDVYDNLILKSVKVYSDQNLEHTIEILDQNASIFYNTIYKKTFNVKQGENRLDLNVELSPGIDYAIKVTGPLSLFRNDRGAQYPYTIDGLISITKSNAEQGPYSYYYFFYDWEVQKTECSSVSCQLSTEVSTTNASNCNGSATAMPSGGQAPYNYNWSNGDNTQTINNLCVGEYKVTVTDANECASIQSGTVDIVSGQEEIASGIMKVFPNPLNNLLNIELNSEQVSAPVQIRVFNLTGKVVFEESASKTKYQLDMSGVAPGTYFLYLQSGKKIYTQKLIKE